MWHCRPLLFPSVFDVDLQALTLLLVEPPQDDRLELTAARGSIPPKACRKTSGLRQRPTFRVAAHEISQRHRFQTQSRNTGKYGSPAEDTAGPGTCKQGTRISCVYSTAFVPKISAFAAAPADQPQLDQIESPYELRAYRCHVLVVHAEVETDAASPSGPDALPRMDTHRLKQKTIRHSFVFQWVSGSELVSVLGEVEVTLKLIREWHNSETHFYHGRWRSINEYSD